MFNLGLEHNANVLAYLTTKIEEEGVLVDLPELDEQLGLSTKTSQDVDSSKESDDSSNSETENSDEAPVDDSSSDDNNEEDK